MEFINFDNMGKKRIVQKTEEGGGVKADANGKPRVAKVLRKVLRGVAHIQATYNNTLITILDEQGNVIAWSSAGAMGFNGTKKATPFAAARVAESVVNKAIKGGLQEVFVRVSGVGSGRDSAIRALANQGLRILSIKDITPLPHNGPRPKKVRRV